MNLLKLLLPPVLLLITITANSQNEIKNRISTDSSVIEFKDTLNDLVFDSITHSLGIINTTEGNQKLIKHFKNIGNEPIVISKVWTQDPHFICKYPKEPIMPNTTYAFTVCFWNKGKEGVLNTAMGFHLSNGEKITLRFNGKFSVPE